MDPLEIANQKERFFIGEGIDVKSISRVYGIEKNEMSRLLNLRPQQINTIFSKSSYSPGSKVISKKLKDMIKIYQILRTLLKTPDSGKKQKELDEKIFQWFRIPNPAFPNAMSPFELISEGKGDVVILSLMDQLHGAAS